MQTLQTSPTGHVCTRIAANGADSQGRADFTDMHGRMAENEGEAIQAMSAPALQIAGISECIRHDMIWKALLSCIFAMTHRNYCLLFALRQAL
jgi:hypothetical protein